MQYVIVLLVALAAFGTWKVQEWRHDALEKQRIEAQREKERNDRRTVDVAATGHEKDKVQIRTVIKTVQVEVDHVVEKPFYVASEQCFDDDGLRAVATAARGAASASEPAHPMPGAKPSR